MSLSDEVAELEREMARLEDKVDELKGELEEAQDALEGCKGKSLAEVECRRCGRPFRGGGLTDYCTKDCENGLVRKVGAA